MQRLFNMFPRGLPGLALVILRLSVGLALAGEAFAYPEPLSMGLQTALLVLVLTMLAGYLTPLAALAALACHVLTWAHWGLGAHGVAGVAIVSMDAVALSLLGPGAYSVDGYRLGRRVLVLPPR